MIEYSNVDALLILNAVEGLGLKRKHKLLSIAEPKDLLTDFDRYKPALLKILGTEVFGKLENLKTEEILEKEWDDLQKHDVKVTSVFDESYPDSLRNIDEYPLLLYFKGNEYLFKNRGVAVVGTRGASRYGLNVTRDFATEFARAGLNVISGFARGVDTAAHKAALDVKGGTIAVVASGLDVCYPAENRALMERILDEDGLFVSEYRLGTYAAQYNFPERNRIISGLADAVFVPEMRIKSGTMITVNHALEQGKDVFVVPANINQPTAEGSNLLLKQMQGALVLSPEDVLEAMGVKADKKQKESVQLGFYEMQILEILEQGETHFEELMEKTGLNANDLQNVVFNMEMNDLIDRTSGNYFTLK